MANLRANKITTGTADYQGSIYASGTSAYLRTTTTAPGTDDFTIECWFNSDAADGGTQEGVFAINGDTDGFQSGTSNQIRLVQGRNGGTQTGGLEVNINGTNVGTANGADLIAEGTWYHVAVTRASGTVKIWIDGVEKASGSAAGDVTGTTFITGYYDGGYTFQGYMSNFRYRKGTAHYTTTFTPPTGPLERTTDTELLFAQSVNNAANGYSSAIAGGTTNIMQVNGNVSANTQAPTQTLTTTSDVGVVFDGDIKINSQGVMYFPTGTTEQRGRGRGVFSGGFGYQPSATFDNKIQYLQIQSQGNTIDFGDLTIGRSSIGNASSSTRGINGGGYTESPATARLNVIDYITFQTTGNATDFGDLPTAKQTGPGACGSNTRGIITWGGSTGSKVNTIDYITIATTGNATDFGDSTIASSNGAKCSSPTRGIKGAGWISAPINLIEYLTIATTGNATDFGDLVTTQYGGRSSSSATRCVWGGGGTPTATDVIQYVEIATTGNSVDFGDLIEVRIANSSVGNSIRGIFAGGYNPSPSVVWKNTMDFVNIASTGNANDFGDASTSSRNMGGFSDSHGGLS